MNSETEEGERGCERDDDVGNTAEVDHPSNRSAEHDGRDSHQGGNEEAKPEAVAIHVLRRHAVDQDDHRPEPEVDAASKDHHTLSHGDEDRSHGGREDRRTFVGSERIESACVPRK